MKYFTKCGREFTKSTKADTTGYHIEETPDSGDGKDRIIDPQCRECPFVAEIEDGYGAAAMHMNLIFTMVTSLSESVYQITSFILNKGQCILTFHPSFEAITCLRIFKTVLLIGSSLALLTTPKDLFFMSLLPTL